MKSILDGGESRTNLNPSRRLKHPLESGPSVARLTAQTRQRLNKSFAKRVVFMAVVRTRCNDRVVGAILASWRYDISGISPEMRRDYEQHFAECAHCSSRQRFHRSLDGTLAVLTSLAALFFLFALAVLKHIKPLEHVAFNILGLDISDMYHMLLSAGVAGLCFSVIALALVLMATPAPSYLGGIAAERAKLIEERLPAAMKSLRPR
jgi:hypothetical protein